MPIDNSVHWKPVRDPHYVLASLQTATYQAIFVEQAVLGRVQQAVRAALGHGHHALGLLLGERYSSPSGANYVLIETLAEQAGGTVRDDSVVAAAIADLIERGHRSAAVLGWFASESLQESRVPAGLAEIHAAFFPRAAEALLVLGERASAGAFFMRDGADLQWYCAPFYEVVEPDRVKDGQKQTRISWPEYTTTDTVVPLSVTHSPKSDEPAREPNAEHRSSTWRSFVGTSDAGRQPAADDAPLESADVSETRPASKAAPPDPVRQLPPRIERRERKRATSAPSRAIDDSVDTSVRDSPERFIELAGAEGFIVAAKFDARETGTDEVIWLLSEPNSGLLVTVVANDTRVVDASLHYNIHTGNADLLNAAFPENRDLQSATVYLREFCIDELRARCRRLRATKSLEREWKVAPALSLLTPSEWELASATGSPYGGASGVEVLSRRRIESLPDPVRRQYRLTPHPDPGEAPGEKLGAG